jgi:hypothetical protein
MQEPGGWILVHKKILEWEWFDDHNTFRLFMYCLLKANYKDKKWKGKTIKRGSFITSLEKVSTGTGLSVRQVRVALNKLFLTRELTKHRHTQYTLIEVTNYDDYQYNDKQHDKRMTNKRQTNDKRMTTTKEYKEIKEKKEYINTLSKFKKLKDKVLKSALEKYPDKDCGKAIDDFIEYCDIKGGKYKKYDLAFYKWVRDDKFDQYKKPIHKKNTFVPPKKHKPVDRSKIPNFKDLVKKM